MMKDIFVDSIQALLKEFADKSTADTHGIPRQFLSPWFYIYIAISSLTFISVAMYLVHDSILWGLLFVVGIFVNAIFYYACGIYSSVVQFRFTNRLKDILPVEAFLSAVMLAILGIGYAGNMIHGIFVVIYILGKAPIVCMSAILVKEIREYRKIRGSNSHIYMGKEMSAPFPSPVYVKDDDERFEHTLILGGTGIGKTSSALDPFVIHDIRTNKHVVRIDPSGEDRVANTMYEECLKNGREFIYIDFTNPKWSAPYNFIEFGNATQLKDKVISSHIWSEPYYKTVAQDKVLEACIQLEASGVTPTIQTIIPYLEKHEKTDGITAFLRTLMMDDCGLLFQQDSRYGAKKFYDDNSVVYIRVNAETSPEYGESIAKFILSDYRVLSGWIKDSRKEVDRSVSLYIDEATKFIDYNFPKFLTMARRSKFAITLSTQASSDFDDVGSSVEDAVLSNTNTKIIMNSKVGKNAETLSDIIGTRLTTKITQQMEGKVLERRTGLGSARDANEYAVHPSEFKRLGKGESVIVQGSNQKFKKVYLDNIFFEKEPERSFYKDYEASGKLEEQERELEAYKREILAKFGGNDAKDKRRKSPENSRKPKTHGSDQEEVIFQ